MLNESFQNKADMVIVFRGIIRLDKDVVEINNHKFVTNIRKYVVHEGLEGSRGIG
jgi:hypothetical protein